jgi:hypothetical protein
MASRACCFPRGKDIAASAVGSSDSYAFQSVSPVRPGRPAPPALAIRKLRKLWGAIMAQTRRYTIEVKDAASKAVVVAAAVDWTSDDRHIAVARIFRLPGLADSKGLIHRLNQPNTAKRGAALAGSQPRA